MPWFTLFVGCSISCAMSRTVVVMSELLITNKYSSPPVAERGQNLTASCCMRS
ncbi:hypothetical protein PF010_g4642 [Phytophthora fragariae]|uniref:Uncharacterized protein n=1 Tax=Phytophthora fragariae TaxID=53985 RepID=A0A6G0LRP0_9STRA|nr:hypothetical protein PF010_g4642 [Phytophthora fragariae]KAE9247029.1 hypothetical protein PF004_g4515 [Phytophthora fragariae]